MESMEMPQPTEAHAWLEKLAGTWTGTEIMSPSPWAPKGGTAKGIIENRMALGGFSLIQEYRQEIEGKVTFEGHGVFSYDGKTEEYLLYWWDSMGMGVNDFRGKRDGDRLTLEHTGPMGHNRTVFDLGKAGTYTFRMQFSPDGAAWMNMMEGTYTQG